MLKVCYLSKKVFKDFIKKVDGRMIVANVADVQNKEGGQQIHAFCSLVQGYNELTNYLWIFSNDKKNDKYFCKVINGENIKDFSVEFNSFINKDCQMNFREERKRG